MKYTGERIIPKAMKPSNGMLIEHIARYEFAKVFSNGRVLDIACGSGYGSEVVCEGNNRIEEFVGIDISYESIEYARKHYGCRQEVSYYVDDALNRELPEKYGQFNTILSFETVEHFEGDEIFISNLYKMLKPGGILLISTPFGRGKGEPCTCPFHAYQYTEAEFRDLLNPFRELIMYNQVGNTVEIPVEDKKYYIMMAMCRK